MRDSLDTSKLSTVDIDGLPTRFYREGEGEPLVLLHGGNFGFVDSLDTWSLNLKGLAEHFEVYALDRPGQGGSGSPARDEDYSQDFTLKHALGFMDALGLESAHLAGHSRGGLLAAQMAFERPELARSLVIVNSATLAPDPEDPRLSSAAFYASVGVHAHSGPWTREEMLIEPVANSFSQEHITDEYIDRYLELSQADGFVEAETRMREGLVDSVFMPNLSQARAKALAAIDAAGLPARTLIIWSANDRSAPLREVGLALYERVADKTHECEMRIFNHAGHYTYREHPSAFNSAVEEFCLRSAGNGDS